MLRGAASAAASLDRGRVATFVAEERDRARALDDELRALCAGALRAVERAASRARGARVRAHQRGRLLSGVALSMMLAACDHRMSIPTPDQGTDGASDVNVVDSAIDIPIIRIGDAALGSGFGPDALSMVCGDGGRTSTAVDAVDAVSIGCCGSVAGAEVTFNDAGIATAITLPDGGVASNALLGCVLGSLASYCYPSWAGTTQPLVTAHCWIA